MESPLVSDTISAEPDISSFKVLYSVSLQTQTNYSFFGRTGQHLPDMEKQHSAVTDYYS